MFLLFDFRSESTQTAKINKNELYSVYDKGEVRHSLFNEHIHVPKICVI